MEFATVFAACLALALALATADDYYSLPVPRDIPQTDVSELPVSVAHDFIRRFGFVKPSDDDIIEYADTVGIDNIDVASGLRGLYTDPALILLEDDRDNTVGYYADTGVNFISAYPETAAVFRFLLDSSNAIALVYRPDRYLSPSEREAIATRFFFPANFKLRDVTAGVPENVPVVDAPVVFRKLEIPVLNPRSRPSNPPFDIDRIPYAYKAPVYLRQPDTGSGPWATWSHWSSIHPIDFDSNPVYPNVDSTYRVLYGSDSLKTESNTDRLTFSVPFTSHPPLPLVTSENIPLTRPSSNNFPATGKFETKRFRTNNIPTASKVDAPVIPPYLIRPEHLKAVTVPVLSTPNNIPATGFPSVSNVASPITPHYVIRPDNFNAATSPILSTATNVPTTSNVVPSITSPYVIRPENLPGVVAPSTNIPATNIPSVSNVVPPITLPYVIRPETLQGSVATVLPTATNVPSVSNVVARVTQPYVIRGEHYNPATAAVPVLPTAQPTVTTPTVSN